MAAVLFLPPNSFRETILALPVLDLFLLDKRLLEIFVPVDDEVCRDVFLNNPFVRFVDVSNSIIDGLDYVVDFSRTFLPLRIRGAKSLPVFVGSKDSVRYRHYLKCVRSMVRDSALNYFLSGDFSRMMIHFNSEEKNYSQFICDCLRQNYICIVIDDSGIWPTFKFADLCLKIIRNSDYPVVIMSQKPVDFLVSIDRNRILDLSSVYMRRYKMSVISRSSLVVGTDLDLTVVANYLGVPSISIVANKEEELKYRLWDEFSFCVVGEMIGVGWLWGEIESLLSKIKARKTEREKEMLWMS